MRVIRNSASSQAGWQMTTTGLPAESANILQPLFTSYYPPSFGT
jgi:hypothetical protein